MVIAHDSGRARSGDLDIFYRRLGRKGATPLLIVHGLSYFSYDWLGVAQALGEAREVLCMDMRGFGDSGWSPQKDYSVPAMAQDIVAVLDHVRWPRAVLLGHSMGGRSAAYAAANHPGRIAGLALIDYTPENAAAGSKRTAQAVGNTPDAFASVEEAMRYFGKSDAVRLAQYLQNTEHGYRVKRDPHFRDQFRRMLETGERPKLNVDMWQVLAQLRCPVLSMRGLRSDMYAPETRERMKAVNARLQVVEVDAGHDVAGDNPAGFLAALQPFLATLENAHAYPGH